MNNEQGIDLTGLEILIVDDETKNVGYLEGLLEKEGYKISVALSGREAIDIASQSPPDLILLDVRMPDIDGFETCSSLKKNEKTKNIPVIFVTAHADTTEGIVKGFNVGGVDYILKPIRGEELFARIRTHLQRQVLLNTQRVQMERFRAIVNNIMEALLIIEADGIIRFLNPMCERLLGFKSDELVGQSVRRILAPPYDERYIKHFSGNVQKDESEHAIIPHGPCEVAAKRKDGASFLVDVSIGEVFLDKPSFIALFRDTSKDTRLNIDSLTGISNRRHFDQFLEREWSRAKQNQSSISLFLIDVDHFKLFNDSYGHLEGDHCLQRVAEVIKSTLKKSSDLAARYGGEEFTVILLEATKEEVIAIAEAIRKNVENLQIPHEQSSVVEKVVTISIGVATETPTPLLKPDCLIIAADKALYKAKGTGRNRICFSSEIDN